MIPLSLKLILLLVISTALTAEEVKKPDSAKNTSRSSEVEKFKSLQSQVGTISYLSLDYTLSKKRKLRNKVVKSKGRAYFAQPSRFRWIKNNSEIIFDGENIFNYSPKENSATQLNLGKGEGGQIKQLVNLILNFDQLLGVYDITEYKEDKSGISAKLIPKEKEIDVKHVLITVDPKSKLLTTIYIQFDNTFSKYEFANHKTEKFADSIFSIPKSVTINKF